jgi:hypothetical protein
MFGLATAAAAAATAFMALAPSAALAKGAPLYLENPSHEVLPDNTTMEEFLAVRWGGGGNAFQCDFRRNGDLPEDANAKPTVKVYLSAQANIFCYRPEEATASGSLSKVKYSSNGTVTFYAKPAISVTLNGCAYKTSKIVETFRNPMDYGDEGYSSNPYTGFKLSKKESSASGCSTTSPFYTTSNSFNTPPGGESQHTLVEY